MATEQLNRTFAEFNQQLNSVLTTLSVPSPSSSPSVAGGPPNEPFPTIPGGSSAAAGGSTVFTTGSVAVGSTSGAIVATTPLTNGQIVVGSTGTAPVVTTITPVANQTTVTNSAGAITIGLASSFANGPTAWTPADGSGASLTFTSVSVSSSQVGNIVFIYGRLTYPSTASVANATIAGLPTPVPNQGYAQIPFLVSTTTSTIMGLHPLSNTSTFAFITTAPAAAVTNATLSGATITFAFWYPVS